MIRVLFLCFLIVGENIFPQDYSVNFLNVNDGLSQSTVNCIVQDKSGYIWLGTSNGLNRFDGYEVKVFRADKEDGSSLSSNGITSLFIDSHGVLWVGCTDGYLNKYHPGTEGFTKYYVIDDSLKGSLPKEYYDYPLPISRYDETSITTITEDKDGFLWLGTWGSGLIRFNIVSEQHTTYTNDPKNPLSINFNRITKALVDRLGVIWVATFGGGLNKVIKSLPVNPGSSEEIAFFNFVHDLENKESLADNKILTLFEDDAKDLWIGTFGGGLDRLAFERRYLTGKAPRFEHFTKNNGGKSLTNNTVMSLWQGNKKLWIGTLGGGLCSYNYKTNIIEPFSPDENSKFIGEDILSISEDMSGNIWAGANLGNGVAIIKESSLKFGKLEVEKFLDNTDIVWAIYKDRQKNIWVGTYRNGILIKQHNGNWKRFNPSNNKNYDKHIRSLVEDIRGNMWIGTYSGGLGFYNKRTNKLRLFKHSVRSENSIPANQVQDLLVRNDTLWIATFGGGVCFADLKNFYISGELNFEKPMDKRGKELILSDYRAYVLEFDRKGNLLIGTFGGGLNVIDLKKKNIRVINFAGNSNSLTDNRVISLYCPSADTCFAGTYGGGLKLYDYNADSVISIKPQSKNIAEAVYGILPDNKGALWISSDNGLFKYDYKNQTINQYDVSDGLQSMEFSGGAYFKDEEGYLYFGGIKGVNYFHPDSITSNNFIPPVAITKIKIFDNEIKGARDKIELSVDENFISFSFAALDFTSPAENKYKYMLEGFDENWHYTNAEYRLANYTNLSPGEYVFKVYGTNGDGVWSASPAEVKLVIVPHFYSTWWFISIISIVVLAMIVYLITLKVRQLIFIEKLKSELAADLHDNIGAGLTEISILSELAAQEAVKFSNSLEERIKLVSERARQLVDSMSDIVWVINPGRDSLFDLVIRLKDSYSETFNQLGIQFRTIGLNNLEHIRLPMEMKQNLFLIFKESINNSIKHSGCNKIIFEADTRDGNLYLSLQDNGIGFDVKAEHLGNGIKNLKNRVRAIGGEIEITSAAGKGTKIKFAGKIKNRKSFFKFRL